MPSKVVAKLTLVKELPRGGSGPYHMAFSPDGQRFAIGFYNKNLVASGVEEQKTLWKTKGTVGVQYGVAFSPDGQTIATCGPCDPRNAKRGGQALLWEARTGKLLFTVDFKVPDEDAYHIDFLADGSSAVCRLSGDGDRIALIRTTNGKATTFMRDEDITAFAVSPRGDEIAIACSKGLEFWSLKTGKRRKRIELDSRSPALAYAPDGLQLAVALPNLDSLALVESKTGKVLRKIKHTGQAGNTDIEALHFDVAAGELVARHARGGIYAFDLKSGKQTAALQAPWQAPNIAHSGALHLASGLYADVAAKTRLWKIR
jgi:WD40 repeat protein